MMTQKAVLEASPGLIAINVRMHCGFIATTVCESTADARIRVAYREV